MLTSYFEITVHRPTEIKTLALVGEKCRQIQLSLVSLLFDENGLFSCYFVFVDSIFC